MDICNYCLMCEGNICHAGSDKDIFCQMALNMTMQNDKE